MSGPARFTLPAGERADRIGATEPHLDAWVSANAGSGKTTILRNRVIRLLLAGVAPDRILCLTFTRAAAAEMQGRIFRELAKWVTLDDEALRAEIAALSTTDPARFTISPRMLALARTLFARAIETPGGLKIQTIHAFAERVLHLFPLEARVPLGFSVLTEADAGAMKFTARQAAIAAAVGNNASPLGRAFDEILAATGTDGFAGALDKAVAALGALAMRGEHPPDAGRRAAVYAAALGVPLGESAPRMDTEFAAESLRDDEFEDIAGVIEGMKGASEKQLADAAGYRALAAARRAGKPWIEAYLAIFLTGKLTPRARVFPAGVLKAHPALAEREAECKAGALAFVERRKAFRTYTRSLALLAFAEFVLARFEAAKQAQNALDFDDLIAALRRLLSEADAGWIMMKLDASIEHVLVDEAQDTTREMWDIVQALTGEFHAGQGQSLKTRTIFVVGDEKQSIFSFQGADPLVFEESRLHFADRIALGDPRGDRVRTPVPLNSSFRSSGDILAAVDRVFADAARREGLTASGARPEHRAAREGFPGRVELWPVEEPAAKDAPPHGEAPRVPVPPFVRLAERIAGEVAGWLAAGARHLADGAPIRPGDILILVQSRSPFFTAVLRALKQRRIPVSGADRLKLQAEPAVRDLLVVAEAAMLEDDDLALATALKTPLFGLDDAALERLARQRPGSLRSALRGAGEPYLRAISARLDRLGAIVHHAAPFAFFSRLLVEPVPGDPATSGRRALLGRLGHDAGDPLDAFLLEAQEFTRESPASVRLFVLGQRERETMIKRDLDQGGDRVRVMTTHGAKGLEARIVFLGDTLRRPDRGKEDAAFILRDGADNPLLVWAGTKGEEAAPLAAARAARRRRQFDEYRRLLYVAMTRAADRLYIGGFADNRAKSDGSSSRSPNPPGEMNWHELVSEGLADWERMEDIEVAEPEGTTRRIRRLRPEAAIVPAMPLPPPVPAEDAPLPGWLLSPLAPDAEPLPPLKPSRGAAATGATPAEETPEGDFRRRRGILVHRLFEWLPRVEPGRRLETGLALLPQIAPAMGEEDAVALVSEVVAHLSAPGLARYFDGFSRAEVAVAGEVALPDGSRRAVAGRIDRLVVTPARIDILDLKTGRPREAGADPAIARQMALYRALLGAIYPGREIVPAVLWTETGALDPLPPVALDAALAGITRE